MTTPSDTARAPGAAEPVFQFSEPADVPIDTLGEPLTWPALDARYCPGAPVTVSDG